MGMRMTRAALLMPLLLAVAACGSDVKQSVVTSTAPPSAASGDAGSLVGWWSVQAEDAPVGAVLALGDRLSVLLPCGAVDGEWAAALDQGLFVASVSGGSGNCFGRSRSPELDWLEQAVRFRVEGSTRTLLDATGRTTAVLRPADAAPSGSSVSQAGPPTRSELRREATSKPPPLPEGVRAPTAEELTRRWVPAQAAPGSKAFVAFAADGTWTGSDGCNRAGGRYVLGAGGRLPATSGPQTLIGCENSPAPSWVPHAARVGLSGVELRFYNPTGILLGAVAPADAAPTTSSPTTTSSSPTSSPPGPTSAEPSEAPDAVPGVPVPVSPPPATPSATSSPDRPAGTLELTEADAGSTVALRVGDQVVLRLAPGIGSWQAPTSDAPSRLRRVHADGGYPQQGVAAATFIALAPGNAQISSTTDAACLHAVPPCALPQQLFAVTVTIS